MQVGQFRHHALNKKILNKKVDPKGENRKQLAFTHDG